MQLTQFQIDYCMECGVCTGSCPVAMDLEGFSPRRMIKRITENGVLSDSDSPAAEPSVLENGDIWACLSCSRCSDRCPVKIDFPQIIRSCRSKARQNNNQPGLSHHGMFQTLTRLQAAGGTQNRTQWAKEAAQIADQGEYYYFSGCMAYYDIAFRYLGLQMLDDAKNHLRLLNRMGIVPAMRDDECCCGHDAYWAGDDDTFLTLAERNLSAIEKSGAKTVIFGCPEGLSIFREAYTERFGPLKFDLIHMTEFLVEQLPLTDISFNNTTPLTVTFQDPCRLGRRSGIYDAPRRLINLIPDVALSEMEHNRQNAVCCGTTGWMECSACSKQMQAKRLEEAKAAGAGTIITSCPKCRIHLTCASKNTSYETQIVDLAGFLTAHIDQE